MSAMAPKPRAFHVDAGAVASAEAHRKATAEAIKEARAVDGCEELVGYLEGVRDRDEANWCVYLDTAPVLEAGVSTYAVDFVTYHAAARALACGARDRDEALRLRDEHEVAAQRLRISEREAEAAHSTIRSALASVTGYDRAARAEAKKLTQGLMVAHLRRRQHIESPKIGPVAELWEPLHAAGCLAEYDKLAASKEFEAERPWPKSSLELAFSARRRDREQRLRRAEIEKRVREEMAAR